MRREVVLTLVWVLSTSLPMPIRAAVATACNAPGGAAITRTTTSAGDVVVVGGGFGHGAGMSQYGARGAALLGCTSGQILRTYYPGTTRSRSVDPRRDNVRVSLLPSHPGASLPSSVNVVAVSDRVPWRLGNRTKYQARASTWRATVDAQGHYTVTSGAMTVFSPAPGPLRITLQGKVVDLPAKGHHYNRGTLRLAWSGSGARTFVTDTIPGLDRYLYGLAEMPSSWPQAALRAQATAGRTYALQRREARDTSSAKWGACRCDVYDSVADQAYSAFDWESVAPAWVAAVNATSGRTLRYNGETITALYHSSSGGWVESAQFVFGAALPYSTSINDSRWERASANPNTTWVRVFDAETVGDRFNVGTATSVSTPSPRGPSGRIGDPARGAGGVVITGTQGTATVSGPTFRTKLALPSALFSIKTD